jgi:trans-aconitate 2-methyltransferase
MTSAWNTSLYDSQHSYVWKYGEEVLELLAPQPGELILDLGAGTGHLTVRIAAAGSAVIGLDASAAMVERARQSYPEIEFVLGNATDFSFPQPFDAVFSNAVLHWIKQPDAVAACVARALKPGGRFVMEFGGKGNVANIVAALEGARSSFGFKAGPDVNPWYYPSISKHAAVLEANGLEVTYARLFDRPVALEGGKAGLRGWIEMFASAFTADVPDESREAFLQEVERLARPQGYRDSGWVADYRRLRIVAIKIDLVKK